MESYDNRRLERSCPNCGGDGVRRQAGAGPAGVGGAQAAQYATTGAALRCRDNGCSGGPSEGSRGSTMAGRAARLAAYERELEELKSSLVGCTDDQEVQLRAELISQIERQAARLRS